MIAESMDHQDIYGEVYTVELDMHHELVKVKMDAAPYTGTAGRYLDSDQARALAARLVELADYIDSLR